MRPWKLAETNYGVVKETAYEVLGRATVEGLEGTINIRVESNDVSADAKLFRVFHC